MNDIINIIEQYYFNKTNKKLIEEYKNSVKEDDFSSCFVFKPNGEDIGIFGSFLYRTNNNYNKASKRIHPFNSIKMRSKIQISNNYWWSSGKLDPLGYK